MADLALAAPPPPGRERGTQLGSGTFGQVYRHASSDSLVIKVLQRPLDVLQDMSEVYALEKGRGHPHIVQLHDVAMDSWEVPEAGVGIGAHRCDLAPLAILQATADGSEEQLHKARAGLGRPVATAKAEEAEVPVALRMISAGYKQHR